MSWNPENFYFPGRKWETFRPSSYRESERNGERLSPMHPLVEALGCESPIEEQLADQLLRLAPKGYAVTCQYNWKGWRIDFAILNPNGDVVAFIECDGAEFHCSAEQIGKDKCKDAAAREAGILMFRFTGSSIYQQTTACAQEVWSGIPP